MRTVSCEEFLAAVSALKIDVHPHIVGDYDHSGGGYTSVWKHRDGRVFGNTWGEGNHRHYSLATPQDPRS